MQLENQIINTAKKARDASLKLVSTSASTRNKVLRQMASTILKNKKSIILANNKDVRLAGKRGISSALLDRLRLTDKRVKEMSDSLRDISNLKDVLGRTIKTWRRPNGLLISKVRVPIGVIGIIYESRPNVTADCIGLCLKTANAVILRGGSEAINSNRAIFNALYKVAKNNGIPEGAISLVNTVERKAVDILLKQVNFIDLIIPRGGESLINRVNEKSRIPVIKHYKGVCHTYVDNQADIKMAERIAFNAKVQRPSVCNAMETLLVHENIASRFLPGMIKRFKNAGVKIKGCANTRKIASGIGRATAEDWSVEYLDLILSVKVVNNIDEAIEHINKFGTRHSDAIVTKDSKSARNFLEKVDSACVYVNASTRFTDGGQFGLGAEMGISTDKIHARGPMGIEELTTYKYQICGSGQIRK